MRTRKQARIWVYRSLVAHSLRKKAVTIKPCDIADSITPAGVKRVQAEMIKLADWLEGKAAKLEATVGIPCGNTRELDEVLS